VRVGLVARLTVGRMRTKVQREPQEENRLKFYSDAGNVLVSVLK
jgi:hypothetical protein